MNVNPHGSRKNLWYPIAIEHETKINYTTEAHDARGGFNESAGEEDTGLREYLVMDYKGALGVQ